LKPFDAAQIQERLVVAIHRQQLGGRPNVIQSLGSQRVETINHLVDSKVTRAYPERKKAGFSLVELLVTITVIAALMAIAIPRVESYRNDSRNSKAIGDLRILDNRINSFKTSNERWPSSLNEIPQGNMLDPWGHSYQYLQIEGNTKAKGHERKDKNLVPINSDFDLYSMGANGKTSSPLTSANSQDDLVRANDGRYYGLASNY
jgi:general secretion pathway protein G